MSKIEPEGTHQNKGAESDRVTLPIIVSQKFSDAIDAAIANEGDNPSRSEFLRDIIAKYIQYDLSAEPKNKRATKYASAEERKAAMLERAKQKRQLTKKLLDAYAAKETEEVIAALVASLKNL